VGILGLIWLSRSLTRKFIYMLWFSTHRIRINAQLMTS